MDAQEVLKDLMHGLAMVVERIVIHVLLQEPMQEVIVLDQIRIVRAMEFSRMQPLIFNGIETPLQVEDGQGREELMFQAFGLQRKFVESSYPFQFIDGTRSWWNAERISSEES